MNTGKLLLKWEDFTEDIRASFHTLRNVHDFTDVTLACEDGVQIEAHKCILAACSSVFANILQSQKHPHPLLFLRGLSYNTISDILDFIYYGEVKIEVEHLNGFIAAAEDLKLKGISSKNETEEKQVFSDQNKVLENQYDETFDDGDFRVLSKKTNNQNEDNSSEDIQEYAFPGSLESSKLSEHNPQDGNKHFSMKNIETSIHPPSLASSDPDNDSTSSYKSDILISDNNLEDTRYECTVCGKVMKYKYDLSHHAEGHTSGFPGTPDSKVCPICEKVFESKSSLNKHISMHHRSMKEQTQRELENPERGILVKERVGYVDNRSQAQKATRRWKDDWMVEVDKQGDRVGDWVQHVDIKSFRCRWCNTTGQFNSKGKLSLTDHSSSGKHERIAAGRKGKLPRSSQPNPYNIE